MKKIKQLCGIMGLLFAVCGSASALPGIDIEAALGGWMHTPAGDVAYVEKQFIQSDFILDVENDLKYEEEIRPMGRIKLDIPIIPSIYIMAAPMSFEATNAQGLSREFQFGDQTIRVDTPFTSKVTLNTYDATLYYGLPFLKTLTRDKLNVDIGLNARIVDAKAELSSPGITTVSESVVAPVPTLYLAAQFQPIERVAFEVEGRGVAIGDDKVLGIIARLRVKVFGPTFVTGGYRYDAIDIDEDDVKIDTHFSGPFLEAGVRF